MDQGFIVLHRKIEENWLWLSESFTKAQAWIDLLLLANYSEGVFFIRGVKIVIKRGQVGKSEESLSQRWKWSRGKTRAFLKMLEIEQQIKQHKSPILNVVEILNYDIYQKSNNRPNNRKTTERQQKDTNNKEITIIKEEEINAPDFIDKNLLKKFFTFRHSIETKNKPFTDDAKGLVIKKLSGFEAKQPGSANKALENSIENSWQGVFEPKANTSQSPVVVKDSFCSQINNLIGQPLLERIYEGEDSGEKITFIKFVSLSSKDKWDRLEESKKQKIRNEIAQKFNGKMRMA